MYQVAKNLRRILQVLVPVLLLLIATGRSAQAYTDPGTGTLIYQILAAGFVGGLFYIRRIGSWIKKKVSKN